MDDSGFSSPTTSALREVSDNNVELYLKLGNSDPRMVFARQQDTLAYWLKQKYPEKKIQNLLVWARIRGSDSELKCVNPFMLACGFIKEKTEVEVEANNDDQVLPKLSFSKLQSGVNKLFFISIKNRKNKEKITKIHKKILRYCDMCVVATPGQNYEEAIVNDGRFTNVDRFTLKQKLSGGEGPVTDMNMKPGDCQEEMTFVVNLKKATQTEKSFTTPSDPSASTCQSMLSDVETEKQSKKQNYNALVVKLWEKNSIYVFSKDRRELKKSELLDEMVECLKARAWGTLVGPKDRERKKFEKALQKLVEREFANQNVGSRPVRVAKILMELYDSVGFLKSDSVEASCFLVSENVVATSEHVVRDILDARNMSTADDHRSVDVCFNFEKTGGPQPRWYRLKSLSYEDNIVYDSLDYAFLYLEECVLEVLPLGGFVRCKVPERGIVCLAGHPNHKEKQEEVCPILPLHNDRRAHEIERRFQENELHCNQSGCALSYGGKCIHSYETKLKDLCREEKALTYDVNSMFEGASGAPVFDLKCQIVALHTAGFRLADTSVIEYGVTFEAIINHLKTTGHSRFVNEHFPHCYDNIEDMDTD